MGRWVKTATWANIAYLTRSKFPIHGPPTAMNWPRKSPLKKSKAAMARPVKKWVII